MNWVEQKTETRENIEVSEAKAKLLNEVRKDLPVVQKEADGGVRPFEALKLQPILGSQTFEAEFGIKGDDVIFHFWPWGYHETERKNGDNTDGPLAQRLPKFLPDFEKKLSVSMISVFKRAEISKDEDIGAIFVRIPGGAEFQFHRDMCVKAASELHVSLGGTL